MKLETVKFTYGIDYGQRYKEQQNDEIITMNDDIQKKRSDEQYLRVYCCYLICQINQNCHKLWLSSFV